MKIIQSIKIIAALLGLSLVTTGCKVLLPAHPNSNVRKGEKVTVELVTIQEALESDSDIPSFYHNYAAAFGEAPGGVVNKSVIAGTIASAVVGFAIDHVVKELEEEAKLYQAQFTASELYSDFWAKVSDKGGEEAKYCGLRLRRYASVGGQSRPVFEFTCGWKYFENTGLWVVKPLSFVTYKSKAKVLGDTFLSRAMLLPILLRNPGHEINSEIEIEMTGHFLDTDQVKKDIPMGTARFKMQAYNLAHPFILQVRDWSLRPQQQGPFAPAPLPVTLDGKVVKGVNLGLFTVDAKVTETDISNTKDSIEKAAKYISSKKSEWQKKAGEAVNPP